MPMSIDTILQIVILILSVVVHEVSHGLMAYRLGDPTAKYAGRLTLNPISHLDPLGSFLIPLLLAISGTGVIFGWAKPVPYNPYNLTNQKWGPALVGLAGPLSNVALALLAGVSMRALLVTGADTDLFILKVLALVITINVLLLVFNMLPIPPLDGSKLLFAVLPISENTKMTLEQYGFIFVFAFLFAFSSILRILLELALGLFSRYIIGDNIIQFLI